MGFRRFCRSSLAIAVHVAFGSPVAWAAEESFKASSELEEIVVTASRSRERLFDSPVSLSVIDDKELARATVPSLAELMRDIPGVQVTDSGQPGLGRIRIRGEESRRTAILVNSQEVTDHYEVGTPLTLQPAMVERVEVMRGSGSVLYGSRAQRGSQLHYPQGWHRATTGHRGRWVRQRHGWLQCFRQPVRQCRRLRIPARQDQKRS